ncbi:hypothetical protein QR680_015521 [Steinernema hermaphroditum]|uniref:7TM GPCR serpentine receptor class x (Srx) domain-containing protein n=1 Tax=Steinernema hermaphroditum TaxID=289476 RepID=A0AA39H804_9BILA|nr:hypothetical protein QR680_015521 [Steinernema hermaphroditum]
MLPFCGPNGQPILNGHELIYTNQGLYIGIFYLMLYLLLGIPQAMCLYALWQPTNIPPTLSIVAYHFAFTFTYIQCIMHWAVAINRLVAVWFPVYYRMIFNKKLCIAVVVAICAKALIVVSLFIVFPCNHIGYSPRFHENVQPTNIPPHVGIFFYHFGFAFTYIQCVMHWAVALNRLVAVWFPMYYRTIFSAKLCVTVVAVIVAKALIIIGLYFRTGVINFITFIKIAYIRITSKLAYHQKEFKRDVRLFSLGVVQDIVMTGVVATVIFCNNDKGTSDIGVLLSYDGIVFIYIVNTASMVFFNKECRRFLLRGMKTNVVFSTQLHSQQSESYAHREPSGTMHK